MSVNNNLNELLKQRNKSLYWLAKETGVSYPTLHKMAKNQTDGIKFAILESICKALECDIADFIELKED